MSTIKVMTHTAGKFVFTSNYSTTRIAPFLDRFNVLYETVRDLPILPALATRLESDLIRRSIFSTAAIEGNPLEEDAVEAIINDDESASVVDARSAEIRNLKAAYDMVKSISASGAPFRLDEDFIKKVHSAITRDIPHEFNSPGHYRDHLVRVGDRDHGGVYTPPKCLPDIRELMCTYVDWINSEPILSLEPIIRAAIAHYYFGTIHPFGDGNGRTARIVEAAILRRSGVKFVPTMLSNYYYRNMDEYFMVFSSTRKSVKKSQDISGFIEFVLRGGIESLTEIKGRIIFFIRKFTLHHFFDLLLKKKDITRRQHALLEILLEESPNFSFAYSDLQRKPSLRALYMNVSDRTARRDLARLRELSFIVKSKDGYRLNWKVLDAV